MFLRLRPGMRPFIYSGITDIQIYSVVSALIPGRADAAADDLGFVLSAASQAVQDAAVCMV